MNQVNRQNDDDGAGARAFRVAWNPVTATWEPTGLSAPRLPNVEGSQPARVMRPQAPSEPPQGYGANRLRALPGRKSRTRSRGRSGVVHNTREQARACSGTTHKSRREARKLARRLAADRASSRREET